MIYAKYSKNIIKSSLHKSPDCQENKQFGCHQRGTMAEISLCIYSQISTRTQAQSCTHQGPPPSFLPLNRTGHTPYYTPPSQISERRLFQQLYPCPHSHWYPMQLPTEIHIQVSEFLIGNPQHMMVDNELQILFIMSPFSDRMVYPQTLL